MKHVLLKITVLSTFIVSCQSNDTSSPGSDADREISQEEKILFARQMIASNPSDDAIDGSRIFRSRCAVCHGVKGDLGVNGAGDLTKTELGLEEKVANIYYGKGAMTPFRGVLKEAEIVGVARYVEQLKRDQVK